MSQMNRRFKSTCHPIWVNHCTSNPTQSSRWDIEWFSIDYLGLIRLYVCIGCLYELYLYSITPGSQSSSTLGFSYSLPLGSLCYAFSASSVTTPCLFREFWAFQTYCCLIIWRHLSSTACTMGLLSDRKFGFSSRWKHLQEWGFDTGSYAPVHKNSLLTLILNFLSIYIKVWSFQGATLNS